MKGVNLSGSIGAKYRGGRPPRLDIVESVGPFDGHESRAGRALGNCAVEEGNLTGRTTPSPTVDPACGGGGGRNKGAVTINIGPGRGFGGLSIRVKAVRDRFTGVSKNLT